MVALNKNSNSNNSATNGKNNSNSNNIQNNPMYYQNSNNNFRSSTCWHCSKDAEKSNDA